jgi:hypothetical protein
MGRARLLTFGGVGASMRRPNVWPDVEGVHARDREAD